MDLNRRGTLFGPTLSKLLTADSKDPLTDQAKERRKRNLDGLDHERPKTRRLAPRESSSPSEPSTGFRELHLPKLIQAGTTLFSKDRKETDPRKHLLFHHSMVLDDRIVVATQVEDQKCVAVRQLKGENTTQKLDMLQKIKDESFVQLLDYFTYKGALYLVLEHEITAGDALLVTLSHFSLIYYPTEQELGVILRQVCSENSIMPSTDLTTDC